MKGILKTYNVGLGDCITFQIQDGVESFNILIDCGEFTDAVRDVIRGDFSCRIDLLVVTHIDEDHIRGVCDLLDTMHNHLMIRHIWFNSIQCGCDMNPRQLSESERHTIERLKECFVANCQSTSGPSSLNDAKLLTEKILSKEDWAAAWNNRMFTSAHEDVCYEGGRWGTFKILSPDPDYLSHHSKDFENMFKAYLYKTDVENLEGGQFLYELLCRLSMRLEPQDVNEGEPSSSIILSEQSVRDFASDDNYKTIGLTTANQMSIAFAWELNGKKILFLGDSHPNKVAKSIEDKYGSMPVVFDAIKVAHHGSEHNVSRALLKAVDSPLFIITGGEEPSKPSYKSIARIICKPLPYREDGSLYFCPFIRSKNNGLLIKRNLLEEYLDKKGLSMFYFILGEKTKHLSCGVQVQLDLNKTDLSAAAKFIPQGEIDVFQPMCNKGSLEKTSQEDDFEIDPGWIDGTKPLPPMTSRQALKVMDMIKRIKLEEDNNNRTMSDE